jgi:hypothetical protein
MDEKPGFLEKPGFFPRNVEKTLIILGCDGGIHPAGRTKDWRDCDN